MDAQVQSIHSSIQLFALSELERKSSKKSNLTKQECQILVQSLLSSDANRQLVSSQIILERASATLSPEEEQVMGLDALMHTVASLDEAEIPKVDRVLMVLHQLHAFSSTSTFKSGTKEHPFSYLARSFPHLMGCLMDAALELCRRGNDGVALEGFFTLILESSRSSSMNDASIMRLVAFANSRVQICSLTSSTARSTTRGSYWWDILVKALLLQVPHPGNSLQSFVLWEMTGLVEKCDTMEDILSETEWRQIYHLLAARIVFMWTNKHVLERQSFDLIFSIICGRDNKTLFKADVVTMRCLLLTFSFLVLDYVAEKRLQKMLVHLCESYLSLFPGDGWVKIAALPLLSCLAQSSLIKMDPGVNGLFQVIESLFRNDPAVLVDGILPNEYNPFYGCIVQCSVGSEEKMVMYYQDRSILPGLRTLFVAFNLFSNFNQGHIAQVTLESLKHPDMIIRKQDVLTFLYLYLYLINSNRFSIDRILIENIPALTRANDVFVTFSCLKIVSTILQPRQETSMLDITGFRSLLQLLQIQRRIFPQVKRYIAGWVNRFKRSQGAGRMKSEKCIERENDLELLVTATIRDLCKQDAHNFGKELLPIIISLLKLSDQPDFGSTRSASSEGTGYLLAAFNECIEAEVTSPQTAWNVVFKSYYEAMNEESMAIIPASLCDFFALVAFKTNEAVEKEIVFRQEILHKYLAPLLSHKAVLVRERAFKSLISFPFAEEASSFIVAPLEFIAQMEANRLPQTASDFLVAKIEAEVENMPRPVFKGLSVETGVSLRGRLQEGGTAAADVAKMQSLAKRLTNAWKRGHKNRAGLAPAVLFNPFYANLNPQEEFRNLASLAMRDIVTSLASPLQLLDIFQAWQTLVLSSLNSVFQSYTSNISEDEKAQLIKFFVESEIQYFSGLAESSTVPSTVASSITIATALLTSAVDLHFAPSFETTSKLLSQLGALLDNNGQRISREVESAIILCLVDLLDVLNNDNESEDLLVRLWSLCLQTGRDDDFIFGYCGGKLLLREMTSLSSKRSENFLAEFLTRFFDEIDGWKSFGAGYSFATILSSSFVDLDDDERVLSVVNHCFTFLKEMNPNVNHQAAAVILSSGWRYLEIEKESVQEVLSNVYHRNQENSVFYSCRVRLQILHSQDAAVLVMKDLIECIRRGSSPNMIACCFDSLRILAGIDFQETQSSKLSKEHLWEIAACCESEVLNNATPVIVRASGWCLGFVLSALANICNGDAGGVGSGLDPKDYRRLNGESSYLKAAFDALKSGSAPVERLLFEKVFMEVKCILPPVDWSDIWQIVESIGDDKHGALLSFLQFSSTQASEKSSKYLVSFLLETIRNRLPNCLNNPQLADFIFSKRGFGKLLELAGVGTKSSSGSISASSLQGVLLTSLHTLSSSKNDHYLLKLIELVRESIMKHFSSRIAGAEKKIVADLQKLLWDWLVDPSRYRVVESDFDFEVVSLVIACCENASSELIEEIHTFTTEKLLERTSLCLASLGNLVLIGSANWTSFLSAALSAAKSSQKRAMEAVFILNWLVASFSTGEKNAVEDKLSLVSKVLDIFILSVGDSSVLNLAQFVWKYFALPTLYTASTGKKIDAITSSDWAFIETQGCLGIFLLLTQQPSKSKLNDQMATRLIKVRDALSIDHTGHVSFLIKLDCCNI